MNYSLTKTQIAVLSLLKAALFGGEPNLPQDVNWKEVFIECQRQTVAALAFSAVPQGALNDEQQAKWKKLSKMNIARNLQVDYEHAQLGSLLAENGIPYVILKGSVSASYYPEPSLRTMGDVDFLINKEDVGRVTALFCKSGFTYDKQYNPYERAFHKEDSVWELHWNVNGAPGGKAGEVIQRYVSNMIDNAEYKSTPEGGYMVPCAFDHGLIMLLHCSIHLLNGGIGLRHLCDWAVFESSFTNEEFCGIFEDKLKAAGLWRFAQILTVICNKYLGSPSKECAVVSDEELLQAVLKDIFSAGNFGNKDETRMDEAKFITNKSKGIIDDSAPIKQIVQSSFDIVKSHWKSAEKYPVLLPIGTAYFGGRYFIRSLTGKRRKIHPKQLISSANARKELYRKLRMFEVE